MLEEECRKHHSDFILREFIRYLIIDKENIASIQIPIKLGFKLEYTQDGQLAELQTYSLFSEP